MSCEGHKDVKKIDEDENSPPYGVDKEHFKKVIFSGPSCPVKSIRGATRSFRR